MTREEKLLEERNRLDKLMLAEMQPFISIVLPLSTIETINKSKKEEIIEKYNNFYSQFEETLLTYQELRAKEYLAQGITIDVLIIALWEMVVENRPEAANMLQTKRQIIKDKYPKP